MSAFALVDACISVHRFYAWLAADDDEEEDDEAEDEQAEDEEAASEADSDDDDGEDDTSLAIKKQRLSSNGKIKKVMMSKVAPKAEANKGKGLSKACGGRGQRAGSSSGAAAGGKASKRSADTKRSVPKGKGKAKGSRRTSLGELPVQRLCIVGS